ncbi:MAG TPA: SRPBCC family protein [Cyclobacteriaceae bacterium]|nr:SRPBCC family protein [Cyclobacteriaceae bacterium]
MERFYVDPDISLAKTLDKSFYHEPSNFELSKEKIFDRCWLYASDITSLDQHQAYPFELLPGFLNESLLLTKKSGKINCLSNVCTHRGSLILDKPCSINELRCPYHGRRFDLEGNIISMPEFKEVKNFPSTSDNLANLKLYNWHGLGFVNIEGFHTADVFFKEMNERVKWMPLDKMQYKAELSRDYAVKSHWALYCENYLEGFHIPFVHAGLNKEIDYGNYTTELFENASLQIGYAKNNESVFDIPAGAFYHGKAVAGLYFFIFPNMMFNFYPWGLSLNIVKPVSIDTCLISFRTYVWDESKLNKGAGAGLHEVEMEDEAVVEGVQKGLKSRYYQHGRYSVNREQGTHHFHRLICKFMNA